MATGVSKNVTERVRELLLERLPDLGYELWNVEFVKSGKDRNLNVFIDKADGISTDDCEIVSRYLGEKLDEEDIVQDEYYLIVSSPGMDRPLLTDEHFERYKGSPVDISLYKGVDGSKKYSGILVERSDNSLVIDCDGKELCLPRDLVSKVKLQVIF